MQDVKARIKVVAAALAGGLMLGATMAGAVAADLGQLPAPFVEDGNLKGAIVIGANAAVEDVIAAAQIGAAFGEYLVNVEGGETTTLATGYGYEDEYKIGADITKTMTPALYDKILKYDKIKYSGADAKSHEVSYVEKILLGTSTNDLMIETGKLLGAASDDATKDKTAQLYLVPNAGAIKYVIEFKNNELTNATVDDKHPAVINLLGKELKIIEVGNHKITVRMGTPTTLSVGQSQTVEGLNIEVTGVYKDGNDYLANLKINGNDYTLKVGEKEVIGDMQVLVDSILIPWDPSAGQPTVKLLVGEETEKTYTDGDAFIGEDENHPVWDWVIETIGSGTSDDPYVLQKIGVTNAKAMNKVNPDYADEQAIEMGKDLKIAGSDLIVKLADTTVKSQVKYKFSVDGEKLKISSDWDYGINNGNDVYVDEIKLVFNETDYAYLVYKDPVTDDEESEKITLTDSDTTNPNTDDSYDLWYFTIGDDERAVKLVLHTIDKVPSYLELTGTEFGNIRLNLHLDSGNVYLGSGEGDDSEEVLYASDSLGAVDYDVLTQFGALIKAGKDVDDEVTIYIPKEQQKVVFYAGEAGKEGNAATTVAKVVRTVIGSEVAVLDNEGYENRNIPLVLVGGPAVNALTREILGPRETHFEEWKTFFGVDDSGKGKGVIKLYDANETPWNVPVLLVAGWDAKDTRAAGYVLAKYLTEGKVSEWAGKSKVMVGGETVTTATVVSTE